METEQKKVIAQMVLKETTWVILILLNILTHPTYSKILTATRRSEITEVVTLVLNTGCPRVSAVTVPQAFLTTP